MGALGALVALRARERTGEGQVVDLGLYEPIVRILDDAIPVFGALGHVRERIGSAAESAAPHNHYESRDGRWIAVACTNDRMFARLARALGTPGPGRAVSGSAGPARRAARSWTASSRHGWAPGTPPRPWPPWTPPRCRAPS